MDDEMVQCEVIRKGLSLRHKGRSLRCGSPLELPRATFDRYEAAGLVAELAGELQPGKIDDELQPGKIDDPVAYQAAIADGTVTELPPEPETTQCVALTKSGAQCRRIAPAGSDRCSTHQPDEG